MPSPEDIAKVVAFAQAHDLAVVQISEARRSVWLSGTVAQLSAAFGVKLEEYDHPQGGTFRGRTGPIMIPADLEEHRRRRLRPGQPPSSSTPFPDPQVPDHRRQPRARPTTHNSRQSRSPSFTTSPATIDGTGECIAIIELGGGFKTADLKTYFSNLGLPMPTVSSVSVDHGTNTPTGNPDGPDGEVMLDIEVAGAVAPKAKIVVYFTPNTSQGFLDAITHAVHDNVNKPSVISISWGGPESTWTGQAFQQFDQAFQAAAAAGGHHLCRRG